MLLTQEQHRRGFVGWVGGTEVSVVIGTPDGSVKSTPMVDSTGSVPDFVPPRDGEFEVIPTNADVVDSPFRIVWDHLIGDEIEARGFDSESGAFHLLGMTGPERLERLVIAVPYLRWDECWTARAGNIALRLINRLPLERPGDEDFVHEEEHSTITVTVGTRLVQGWLIDIIAPKGIGDHVEIAYSVLALLGLAVGDAAIGTVIQRDEMAPVFGTVDQRDEVGPMFGLAGHEIQVLLHPIPSAPNQTLRMPIPITEDQLREFDRLLTRLVSDEALRNDTLLALRWLERAWRKSDEIDRFTAAVTGLDSLVTLRSERHSFEVPFAEILSDPRVAELLAPLRSEYPDEFVKRLLERLLNKQPSAQDRFTAVAELLRLGPEASADFREANKQRGPLVHGSTGKVKPGLAGTTTKLLEKTLLSVLRGRGKD
jgi:hypothetical protein